MHRVASDIGDEAREVAPDNRLAPSDWLIGYDVVFNSVVALALGRYCRRETPCSASFHQP